MAPKLYTKPLTATVKERLRAHRAAPPTAVHVASILRLTARPAPTEHAEPMANKKKGKGGRYADEYKATIVARALKARDTGDETIKAIADAESIHETLIYNWLNATKKTNGASPSAATSKPKSDIKSLSRELSEAMEHVSKLKTRLRKLLGDE
jgi:transposase-like protein